MSEPPARKPRGRRPLSWGVHDAQGIRYPGGDGPNWWDDARPADPAPAIYCGNCTDTPEPAA